MSAIEFSKEQAMLLDIASRFFADKWTVENVREQLVREQGYDRALWAEIVDLGWPALAIPEQYGGIGLGMTELVTIVEPMGRSLGALPFVGSQLAGQALIAGGTVEQKQKWLPRLAEGAIATLAVVEPDGSWLILEPTASAKEAGSAVELAGSKTFVADLPEAELVLVSVSWHGAPALALLEGVEPERAVREVVIDETRRSYGLALDGVTVEPSALIVDEAAQRSLAMIARAGMLLSAAEASGGTAAALALIVDYLGARRQFGRLIGSYQALKHPTVDVLIALERARSHVYHAATVIDSDGTGQKAGDQEIEAAVRIAKAESCDAMVFAADRAVQFHGGVGFTYECDAQLYLRRALWCQYQFGDAPYQRQLLADLLLAG